MTIPGLFELIAELWKVKKLAKHDPQSFSESVPIWFTMFTQRDVILMAVTILLDVGGIFRE